LRATLPPGVEIVETYNRADLVDRAVENLRTRLVEECVVVLLVCFAFLVHPGCAGVVIVALPLALLAAFAAMRWQGLNANIMALAGIAIAIGAMVDAAIVMVENVHRKLEQHPTSAAQRLQAVVRVHRSRAHIVRLAADRRYLVRSRARAAGAGGAG
jgi:copper/silver efflux system protein